MSKIKFQNLKIIYVKAMCIGLTAISGAVSANQFQHNEIQKNTNITSPLLSVGLLRLESERSYKLSLQMVLGILNGHTKVEKERSYHLVERFRKDMLKASISSEKTNKAFKRVNSALNYQVDELPKLNSKTASVMYDTNEDLLNKLNFLSFAIESESDDTSTRVVGLAMRQASLAQRIAKIILLQSLDKSMASKQGLKVDLTQSRIEFINGMALLNEETNENKALKHRLVLAQQQWKFYDAALNSQKMNAEDLRNISSTSDRIAQMMVEIVRLGFGLSPDPSLVAEQ